MSARAAIRWLIALVVIVIVVIVLSVTGIFKKISPSHAANTSQWQAVFLDNGQVYFGKVTDQTSDEVVLENIYYLQVDQQIQPDTNSKNNTTQQPKLSLIKLGNELHGPKDVMRINRQHVTFIEDLKDDGRVVSAINDFLKNGGQTTNSSPSPVASPTK